MAVAASGATAAGAPVAALLHAPGAREGAAKELHCKCAGLVPDKESAAVFTILRGMCVRYESFRVFEYGLSFPLRGGASSGTCRLVHNYSAEAAQKRGAPLAPPPVSSWALVQESPPFLGPAFSALPTSVREHSAAPLFGRHALHFMHQLGAKVEYSIERRGNSYMCMQQGMEVEVRVCVITQLDDAGRPTATPTERSYLLEASCKVPPGTVPADAARALGAFGARLAPMVRLQPA